MMERNELLRALRSTAADQHRCFGCGYEYKCSIRGCAINRAAAELIVQLAAENEALRHPTNPPLTLEELREMDGKPVPVWCDKVNGYIFIAATKTEPYNQVWFFNHKGHWDTVLYYHTKFYRRKPEEGT